MSIFLHPGSTFKEIIFWDTNHIKRTEAGLPEYIILFPLQLLSCESFIGKWDKPSDIPNIVQRHSTKQI
jgi:hypothetical protein